MLCSAVQRSREEQEAPEPQKKKLKEGKKKKNQEVPSPSTQTNRLESLPSHGAYVSYHALSQGKHLNRSWPLCGRPGFGSWC